METALQTAVVRDGAEILSPFARAAIEGLSRRPKSLPCAYLYDARGSELFEEITRLSEYYPTRAETEILQRDAARLVGGFDGAALVEFGSGSSAKTEILLRAAHFAAYAPVDVSATALREAAQRLRKRFPHLTVGPVLGDFTHDIHLSTALEGMRKVGFFPGSTIGNFAPPDAQALLAKMASLVRRSGRLVIGVDMPKDVERLIAAYDDRAGVTALFNLNLLVRMKRELGADVDVEGFVHRAVWDDARQRIEMHLVSRRRQRIRVAGRDFRFEQGETIHTENSYKYSIDQFRALAAQAGWRDVAALTDDENLFSVHLLEAM